MTARVNAKMPVVDGLVGETVAKALRDTGCSRVVVKKNLVRDNHFTGKKRYILLIDKTIQEVPLVKI